MTTRHEEVCEEHFDPCTGPCKVPVTGGRSFSQQAQAIWDSGVDTSLCLHGVDGISCPWLTEPVRHQLGVIAEQG